MVLKKDLAGGLAIATFALVAFISTFHLETGTMTDIGTGFFPKVLSLILFALAILGIVAGLVQKSTESLSVANPNWRVLLGILGALVAFAITIRGADFGALRIPAFGISGATPLAILVAGAASPETRWWQLALYAVALTLFCALLFRFFLGLPLPLAPWLIGY
jgi:hypothetical protein